MKSFEINDIVIVNEQYNNNKSKVGQIVRLESIDSGSHEAKFLVEDVFGLYKWTVSFSRCCNVRLPNANERIKINLLLGKKNYEIF